MKPGERVVAEGVQKVRQGMQVNPKPTRPVNQSAQVTKSMSKFFINRPIVAMVIAIFTVIVGAVAIAGLPVAQFPDIAPPEVQVSATYVGADAQTIEQSVATPIEQQMSGVDNMNYMYSLNATANGQMRMIVDFDVETDPEHRPDPRAEPRNAGGVAASRRRDQLRRHGAEIGARAADAGRPVLAQGHLRRDGSWPTTPTSI